MSPGLLRRAPLPTAQPRPEGRAPLTHAPERCEMAAAARGAEAPPPPLPLSSCPRRHCGIPRRVAGQSGPRARQERYKKAGTARGSITCCRQPPHSRRAFPPAGSGGIQAAPASRQERPRFRPRLGRWRRAPRAVTSILCPHPASAAPIWSRAGEEGAGAGGGHVAARRAQSGARAAAVTAFLLRARRPSPSPASSPRPLPSARREPRAAPSPPGGQKGSGAREGGEREGAEKGRKARKEKISPCRCSATAPSRPGRSHADRRPRARTAARCGGGDAGAAATGARDGPASPHWGRPRPAPATRPGPSAGGPVRERCRGGTGRRHQGLGRTRRKCPAYRGHLQDYQGVPEVHRTF